MRLRMSARIWTYPGKGGWHFLTLPKKESGIIRETAPKGRWGAIPVTAAIGRTTWKTSVFPEKGTGAYCLPLKEDVRTKEKIGAGKIVEFQIEF